MNSYPMWYEFLLKRGWIPETLLRYGIRSKLDGRMKADPHGQEEIAYLNQIYNQLQQSPIAIHTQDANEQHYELPSSFFETVLGPRLKYSSCYYADLDSTTLAEAEEEMLALTVERAGVVNGDKILDLGCGWGSLTLYLAEHFPDSSITAISNSRTQKAYIDEQLAERGYDHVEVITANIGDFTFEDPPEFNRILSVEMFEHMRNYRDLLEKLQGWLAEDGTLFVHMFARHGAPYLFESGDSENFMARYFFTGGTMLSISSLQRFSPDNLELSDSWEISGRHYARTLRLWLDEMKANKEKLLPILKETYGQDYKQWWEYWKIFFIVCEELFAYQNGKEWVVMHYLFQKVEHT